MVRMHRCNEWSRSRNIWRDYEGIIYRVQCSRALAMEFIDELHTSYAEMACAIPFS